MDEGAVKVDETYDRLEEWFEDNKNIVFGVLSVLGIIVLGFFAYKTLIIAPKEKEASSQIFKAQQYFEADSFRLALEGDENYQHPTIKPHNPKKMKLGRSPF